MYNYELRRNAHHCDACGCEKDNKPIHIGGESRGHVFVWQGFTAEESPSGTPLTDAVSWKAYLQSEVANGAKVFAEAGYEKTLNEFLIEVELHRGLKRQGTKYPEHYQTAGPDEVSYGTWF